MQQLKCHGSPGKNSSFNLYWSQNTQPCKSRNSGSSEGAGALPSMLNSNTPGATSCFQKWLTVALSREREKQLRNRGILLSTCPTAPFRNGDTREKKIAGCGFSNLRGKSILQPQAPPQRVFTFFFFLCSGTAPGSRILFSGEAAGAASVHGQRSLFLAGHHLKTPQGCTQLGAADKTALPWHFLWNNHRNKQLQWHTVVGWR